MPDTMPIFKVGDLVMLKSGGPSTTVYNINELFIETDGVFSSGRIEDDLHVYVCKWFNDGDEEWGMFSEPCLVPLPTDTPLGHYRIV